MMNLNFDELESHPGGRMIDPRNGLFFPWYTKPFLQTLCNWDIKNWRVFEYGCGDSTKWWKTNVKEVISVDSNTDWCNKCGAFFTNKKNEFISFPTKFIYEEKFDCIIIDGEPVEWRDECTIEAIKCLKEKGILIIDNYKQKSVNLLNWPITDELLKSYESFVFKQENHNDWKTAYWII